MKFVPVEGCNPNANNPKSVFTANLLGKEWRTFLRLTNCRGKNSKHVRLLQAAAFHAEGYSIVWHLWHNTPRGIQLGHARGMETIEVFIRIFGSFTPRRRNWVVWDVYHPPTIFINSLKWKLKHWASKYPDIRTVYRSKIWCVCSAIYISF